MSDLPLTGIRVVDLSRVLAGPFATMLLGDLGADVIKVEPPDGDETRNWGPPWWGDPADRRSAYFASVNRNKRSVVLDLRTDDGRVALDRLLARSDLLVHNYRPATALRLGLETDALRERHPDLVVATVGGFPGADAERPAYDLLAQAVSGLMSVTGERRWAADEGRRGPARPHRRARVRRRGSRRARRSRSRVGRRRRASTSSRRASPRSSTSSATTSPPASSPGDMAMRIRTSRRTRRSPRATAHLVVAVGNDAQFGRLLAALGLDDPAGRFATNTLRVAARGELTEYLGDGDRFLGARTAAWPRCSAADVPAGPVNSVPEAVAAMGDRWVSGARRHVGCRRVRSGSRVSSRRCGGHHHAWVSTPRRCWPRSSDGVERETGIEPATCSLEGCRSAN